ncbi:hypothetical protein BJY01DRAFT_256607 [Aspergillus pseudoustus]|uniref:Uncharacterized protein n=1 Tax=Aspergillus pseudoustus TaxID=1810923 RepID=A0ABR4I709_9EURO
MDCPELRVPRDKLDSPLKDNETDIFDSIATAETLPRDEAWELREALARTIHGALDESITITQPEEAINETLYKHLSLGVVHGG